MRVYLDNAATTPIAPEVIDVMTSILRDIFGNPSSIHQEGRQAKTIIERSRKSISTLLGVAPGEILFTGSGTEADNMAIRCAVQDLGVTHIISSTIEHHAVTHTVENCAKQGVQVNYVRLKENGHVDLEDLDSLLQNAPAGKCLVSLMHANNEIGNLLDVKAVGELCKTHGAYFHCDMVQTVGHFPLELKNWNVHFSAASAHKFNGPKGVGFIYIDNNVKVKPFINGGAQERNMRGGTENVQSIAGMAKALEIAYEEMEQQTAHITELKRYMKENLEANVPGIYFNGDCVGNALYTVLNVAFPPSEAGDMLIFNLDIEGIAVSGGSACASGSDVGSHVLSALPRKDAYNSIRFSFGKNNTIADIDYTMAKLVEILKLKTTSAATV